MTWIIIGLILLAAFGPVLWLVPSKRDRHLSALRDQARREGLLVELRRLPKLNPTAEERVSAGGRVKQPVVECAAYTHGFSRRLTALRAWRVLRGDGDPQVRPGWEIDPQQQPELRSALRRGDEVVRASLESLDSLFEALPGDVVGVELTPRSLSLYWLESRSAGRSSVTRLSELMAVAERQLLAVDDGFRAEGDDDDS